MGMVGRERQRSGVKRQSKKTVVSAAIGLEINATDHKDILANIFRVTNLDFLLDFVPQKYAILLCIS
jgi:hypothetical protein